MMTPQIAKTRDGHIYHLACRYFSHANFYIVEMAYWIREPDKYEEVDMVEMIAAWATLGEYFTQLKQIGTIPIEIKPEDEERLQGERLYTYDYLKGEVPGLNGVMQASEDHNIELYEATIRKYLDKHLAEYRELLAYGAKDQLHDEYDYDAIINQRDTLEYFRSGLHVIRMTAPPGEIRLTGIDYYGLVRTLRDLDEQLKPIYEREKKRGKITKYPSYVYIPETFWWKKA